MIHIRCEVIKLFLIINDSIGCDLNFLRITSPVTSIFYYLLAARIDSKVVLPAPEGPIMARQLPGEQYPVTPSKIVLLPILAEISEKTKFTPFDDIDIVYTVIMDIYFIGYSVGQQKLTFLSIWLCSLLST